MLKILFKGLTIKTAPKGFKIVTGIVRANASMFVDLYGVATAGQTEFTISALTNGDVEAISRVISLSAYGAPQSLPKGDFSLSTDGKTIIFADGLIAGTEVIGSGAK